MKFNLYHRLLLSYAPIFFLVISVLIFAFFSLLNNSAKQQILETNEVISNQIVNSLDANLEVTERILIREMLGNQAIKLFYNDQKKSMYDYFYISQKLDEISASMSFVNSIYLYHAADGIVLSRKDLIPIDKFADHAFIESVYNSDNMQGSWTDPREFKEVSSDGMSETVVSLAKPFPLPKQKRGMIVVNVRVDALFEYMSKLNGKDLNLIKVYDSQRRPFPENNVSWASNPQESFDVKLIAKKSDYTGWHFETGMRKSYGFSVMSVITNIWTILGFMAIVFGITWMTYVTHRNYKPIQAIIGRLHEYAGKKSGRLVARTTGDEYKFIESAIENLMEKSTEFEKMHQDDLIIRKKHFFAEWLEGYRTLQAGEWQEEMGRFGKPSKFSRLVAVVIELDGYAEFVSKYNQRDQYLLKFIVQNVFEDLARGAEVEAWSEWTDVHQLISVLYLNENHEPYQEKLMGISEGMQQWIGNHLEFTVSIGIGAEAVDFNEIHFSHDTAMEYISYKPIFGSNQIIGHWSLMTKAPGDVFHHLQTVRRMAELFRSGEELWRSEFNQLAQSLKQKLISKSDLKHLADYLIFHFHKEIMMLTDEIRHCWTTTTLPAMEEAVTRTDTVDLLFCRIESVLRELEVRILEIRNERKNTALVAQVKEYLKGNYHDTNLSLNQVSDAFNISSRYLSRIFKEELGVNFIDFLVEIRMKHAARMLLESDEPIQQISERVGYIHAMSFIRTFKKYNGSTPGEYRKRRA
jgi:two-component system response regulator YesN